MYKVLKLVQKRGRYFSVWWWDLSGRVEIDEMQCCFMSDHCTIHAIFSVRQI